MSYSSPGRYTCSACGNVESGHDTYPCCYGCGRHFCATCFEARDRHEERECMEPDAVADREASS